MISNISVIAGEDFSEINLDDLLTDLNVKSIEIIDRIRNNKHLKKLIKIMPIK